jgi:hypothetical protein
MAKALEDKRLIDIPLSSVFYRWVASYTHRHMISFYA